ncbi:MAG TPA: MerR family transcriptional regulator [Acidimicrobiia bacterium]|nr:MerR family transcriptional regulator [Acidimicrobiia bacterium]
MTDEHHQIGTVADRVDLSLRTIRYYEEIGLVIPSGRTEGGFRLYTESDIERLLLVKSLKPLGMPLEMISELLDCADQINRTDADEDPGEAEHRLESVLAAALTRCDELEQMLAGARESLQSLSLLTARGSR